MMKKYIYLVVAMFIGAFTAKAQDPMFTQFYAAPLHLGPSFAGGNGESRVILNFRDQWPKLSGDYVTFALSVDHFLEKYNSGIGLLILRDETAGGLITMNNVGFNYNYNFNLSREWKLSPGLQVYYYTRNINFNKLIFNDQLSRNLILPSSIESERLGSIEPVRHLDVSSSLLAYSDQFWMGFTVDHLLSLNKYLVEDGIYLPIRVSMYGGGKYILSGRRRNQTKESITGAFNLMIQDKYKYLDIGAYYSRSPMLFGIWYRGLPVFPDNPNNGAITLQFGYSINNIALSYSYDYTLSRLMTKTGGAHEISLSFSSQSVKKRSKKRMIPCPTFQ
ncbi:MAG TPA: PorP/SprF family type IX secretion system membrane protein [Bacteroidales bacterium]|nr:PorP/SprF family type IX secretion system membrane protein [Bacteroidales bacterium]